MQITFGGDCPACRIISANSASDMVVMIYTLRQNCSKVFCMANGFFWKPLSLNEIMILAVYKRTCI